MPHRVQRLMLNYVDRTHLVLQKKHVETEMTSAMVQLASPKLNTNVTKDDGLSQAHHCQRWGHASSQQRRPPDGSRQFFFRHISFHVEVKDWTCFSFGLFPSDRRRILKRQWCIGVWMVGKSNLLALVLPRWHRGIFFSIVALLFWAGVREDFRVHANLSLQIMGLPDK